MGILISFETGPLAAIARRSKFDVRPAIFEIDMRMIYLPIFSNPTAAPFIFAKAVSI